MSDPIRSKRNPWARWKAEDGAISVEFAIVIPLILSIFFLAVDSGITMLRQVFLERAVDMAVREVRLGRVNESSRMSELICERTAMVPNCLTTITVEMQPIDTSTFDGLDGLTQCINREEDITPALAFNPGAGGAAQELMLIRVCVAADPFMRMTGYVSAIPINTNGDYVLVSNSVFVNEPR